MVSETPRREGLPLLGKCVVALRVVLALVGGSLQHVLRGLVRAGVAGRVRSRLPWWVERHRYSQRRLWRSGFAIGGELGEVVRLVRVQLRLHALRPGRSGSARLQSREARHNVVAKPLEHVEAEDQSRATAAGLRRLVMSSSARRTPSA